MTFEQEINEYEALRQRYQAKIVDSMASEEFAKFIRTEATDEHLVRFFFKMAMRRMKDELAQKERNTNRLRTFVF